MTTTRRTETEPIGSILLARARQMNASALETLGLDPQAAGEPATPEQADKLERMMSMPCYHVPSKVVALARQGALTRPEAEAAMRGAFGTWRADADPAPFEMPPARRTFTAMRFGNRAKLAAAGHIGAHESGNPGRGRGRGPVTPRQVERIRLLAQSPDFDVPDLQVELACRGILTCTEASRVITAAQATYLHLAKFSLDVLTAAR